MKTALLNNRYRILECLGKGGFGETFLAVDTHLPSARKCAIKQLIPTLENETLFADLKTRFQREAATLEALGDVHGQIPKLYAYFAEHGHFFLVQEWIEGITLEQHVQQQGPMTPAEVRALLISLLQVLQFVHDRRIIHRDIKPDNIMLREADCLPVLIDFGAMKEAIATHLVLAGNYSASMSIGTPGYMPSEQAAGRPIYSSDLYSLGLTAIYLLTKRSPQEIETDPNTGELQWHKLLPKLSMDLDVALTKALAFHPRDRFSRAQDMLAVLLPSRQTKMNQTVAVVFPASSKVNSLRRVNLSSHSQMSHTLSAPKTAQKTMSYGSLSGTSHQSGLGYWVWLLIASFLALGAFGISFGLSSWYGRSRTEPLLREPSKPKTFPSVGFPKLDWKTETSSPSPVLGPGSEATDTLPERTETDPKPPKPKEQKSAPPKTRSDIPNISVNSAPVAPPTSQPKPSPTQTKVSIPEEVTLFLPSVSSSNIESIEGQPDFSGRGSQMNTELWRYQNRGTHQLDIAYLIDQSTGKVRQTEVQFQPSVPLDVIQETLNQVLGGATPKAIESSVKEIYHSKRKRRSISNAQGTLKGSIARNFNNQIDLRIWTAD